MNWISIKHKLPDINKQVLVYYKERFEKEFKITTAYLYNTNDYNQKLKEIYEWSEDCGCSGYEFDKADFEIVTHWMPLPEPPKNEM